MRGQVERPDGLAYRPDVLSEGEEAGLLSVLDGMSFDQVEMRGQVARRTVRHFGYRYDFESWRLVPADPLPEPLAFVRERCAELAGVPAEALAETLLTRYPPGATIGWHRDAPTFGPTVIGVSLRAPCVLRFQRTVAGQRRVFELELAPRSMYALTGAARSAWQHSIPPVADLRYSITFRTVRRPRG